MRGRDQSPGSHCDRRAVLFAVIITVLPAPPAEDWTAAGAAAATRTTSTVTDSDWARHETSKVTLKKKPGRTRHSDPRHIFGAVYLEAAFLAPSCWIPPFRRPDVGRHHFWRPGALFLEAAFGPFTERQKALQKGRLADGGRLSDILLVEGNKSKRAPKMRPLDAALSCAN